jgi:hypothetical protein
MAQSWNDWNGTVLPWQNTALPWKNTALPWNNTALPWKQNAVAVSGNIPEMQFNDELNNQLLAVLDDF